MCGTNKAPGPDGYNLEFYKVCWGILKVDVMDAINELFCKEKLNVVMPGLISNAQGDFVKDRQILDGIPIANECVDSILRQKKPGIIYKIDMQKDFDNVSWPSLFSILEKNVFRRKWIQWIKWCVTASQLSILVNGEAANMIKPSKEVLSLLVNDVVSQNRISGFQVVKGGTVVSHLQFVDDTIIFLNASRVEVRRLLIFLFMFEVLTGLKLNLEKSSMICVGEGELVEDLEIGCKTEFLPVTYLGMPIEAGRRSIVI
ncbi:uncharacterized protein LOC113305658 [Papaver somniferum]|uniref:uncharacterized protein LOC113305658 n=1 Tax=Papaver somniferum TaxID=3469 RepID=UPI000E6F7C5F|nr:uncharacterized protein LOC113305658 [Papaver somniferum]